MLREIFTLLSLLIANSLADHGAPWSYTKDSTNPSQWAKNIRTMCSGLVQSPIDLDTNAATYLGSKNDFVVEISSKSSNTPENFTAENNGHSLQVQVSEAQWHITLNKKAKDYFRVLQFHFHWGNTSIRGSEHTLDKARFPLEMHIVGYSSIYDNAAQAKSSPAGLTVIGVFFKMTKNPAESSLSKMGNLLSAIGSLTFASSTTNVSYFDPKVLLPENKEFFRYQGSLTTPPCTENVQWTMMRHALRVNEADLKKLRSLRFGDSDGGKPMQNNFRPVQPLTAEQAPQPRVLYKSWSSASTRLAAGLCVIILGITFSTLSN